MNLTNIHSGDDYADILMADIRETHSEMDDNNIDSKLLDLWEVEIRKLCNEYYPLYIKGIVDTFMISDLEMKDCFERAVNAYTIEVVAALVESDLVDVSVGSDGEFRYSLSDKGRDYADQLNIPEE